MMVDLLKSKVKASSLALMMLPVASSEKAGEPSRLKRPKSIEIPKFDVNKPGMQTFLNSMELLSQSYKFNDDKELAQFYLNNLTESSKTTIFTIYPLSDKSFYESSAAVISYLKSFISPNIRINAMRDIRTLKMTENGGLYAYYKSFTILISRLGPNSMNKESIVLYFIAGLNANAVRNTNVNLHMHTFYASKPNSTVTDLYAEADKVISLSGTNSGIIGLGKRAGPDRGEPRPQQKDRGYTGYSQRPNPQHPQQTPKKRSDLHTSGKDVVCSKCHNKGHTTASCRSSWTKEGKFIGKGEPPPGDYWTQRHAADLKAKKAAMVKTPPHQPAAATAACPEAKEKEDGSHHIDWLTLMRSKPSHWLTPLPPQFWRH